MNLVTKMKKILKLENKTSCNCLSPGTCSWPWTLPWPWPSFESKSKIIILFFKCCSNVSWQSKILGIFLLVFLTIVFVEDILGVLFFFKQLFSDKMYCFCTFGCNIRFILNPKLYLYSEGLDPFLSLKIGSVLLPINFTFLCFLQQQQMYT